MQRLWIVAAILIPLTFSGCAGQTDSGGNAPQAAETAEEMPRSGAEELVLVSFDGTPIDATSAVEGTLPGVPTCGPGCTAQETHDVSNMTSKTYYTRLSLEFSWTMGSGAIGSPPVLQVDSGDAHVLDSNTQIDFAARRNLYVYVLKAGSGPVSAIVSRSDAGFGDQAIQYTLNINAYGNPRELLPGMRIHIPVPPDTPVTIGPASDDASVEAKLFTMEGRFVADINADTNTTLPFANDVSSHVLFLNAASASAVLWVPDTLRFPPTPVYLETVYGPPRPYRGVTTEEWTFDVSGKTPVRAGLYYSFETTFHVEPVGLELFLESPNGVLLERTLTCPPPCLIGGPGRSAMFSAMGDPALVLGTYTARVESPHPRVTEVGEVLSHFKLP